MAEIYEYYYVGAETDEQIEPRLLTFSHVKNGPAKENAPHSHPYLEVFLFEKGEGVFESGGKRVKVRAGDVLAVAGGVTHVQYSGASDPLSYYCFAATGAENFGGGFTLVGAGEAEELRRHALACKAELGSDKPLKNAAASAHFKLLYVGVLRASGVTAPTKKPSRADEIRTYIEAHSNDELSLYDICKHFYIAKSTLLYEFRTRFGISPLKYLNVCRIERSKKLLAAGASVTEVALAVGFSGAAYFTELFRRRTGYTPSAFKKLGAGDTE